MKSVLTVFTAILATVVITGCSSYGEYEKTRVYGIVDAVYSTYYYNDTPTIDEYLAAKVKSGEISQETSDAIKACTIYMDTNNYRGHINGERDF